MQPPARETNRAQGARPGKTPPLAAAVIIIALALAAAFLVHSLDHTSPLFASRAASPSAASMAKFPQVVLWAWERPEELTFIDTRTTGVAFIAATIFLSGDKTIIRPRLQPLRVSPGTRLIAVTRVETDRREKPLLSTAQRWAAADAILESARRPGVEAAQIDFDAKDS